MISDADLDGVLQTWFRDGGERAPAPAIEAALATVATTRQRRSRVAALRQWAGDTPRSRVLLVAMLVGLLALAGIGVVVGLGQNVVERPTMPSPITRSTTDELRPVSVEDWSVRLSIPERWTEIATPCCDYRAFAGPDPEGLVAVGHESPYQTGVCLPACQTVEVASTIPYSADAQLEALRAAVGALVGSSAWVPLADGFLPELVGGVRLDTVGVDESGRQWQRVHVIGIRDRNVVAISWAQPDGTFDAALFEEVLATVALPSAPAYSDGDPVAIDVGPFSAEIPGLWVDNMQPRVDGVPLSGVYDFADGRVLVSIGTPGGRLGWCDPDCAVTEDVHSLDDLERAIRRGHTLGTPGPIELDGEAARSMIAGSGQRYVIAIHDRRPVAVRFDAGDWTVAADVFDKILESFRFIDTDVAPVDHEILTADGQVLMALSNAWSAVDDGSVILHGYTQRMTVRIGSADGRIMTCDRPAAPWELCREITATTLEDLAEAVRPANIDDHGVGPPTGRRTDGTLDGETSAMIRIEAYEYPARSGQEVVYIVAIHDGRPVIVRIHTSNNHAADVDSVIAGFRFVD